MGDGKNPMVGVWANPIPPALTLLFHNMSILSCVPRSNRFAADLNKKQCAVGRIFDVTVRYVVVL